MPYSIVFQGHPSNFKAWDKMDATLLLLEILYSRIRKETNIPILVQKTRIQAASYIFLLLFQIYISDTWKIWSQRKTFSIDRY